MDPSYRIRKARTADFPQLREIERVASSAFERVGLGGVTSGDATSIADFVACAQHDLLWVAADAGDGPVGFAFVEIVGGLPHLDELDVHPDHGRRGIGAQLVHAVLDWARSVDFPAVTLTTFRDVPWNRPFYERLGFVVVDEAEQTPELRALVQAEARRGLPPAIRVVMRCPLHPPRAGNWDTGTGST